MTVFKVLIEFDPWPLAAQVGLIVLGALGALYIARRGRRCPHCDEVT